MKTIINKLFTLVILIALVGCTKTTTLKIEFENVAGLDEKSPVLIGGLKVGSIKDFKIQPNSKILVEIQLDKDVTISKDATFRISSLDILGGKGITIENGTSDAPIDFQVVQQGQKEKPLFGDSTVVNIMDKVVTKFSTTTKLDSIESELKKLNKNIEKLNEKK